MPYRPATMKPNRIRSTASKFNAVTVKRRTTNERGYDAVWQKLRALFLIQHPLCKHCDQQDGRAVPATDVDHIIDIRLRPDLRLDESNLQPLCKTHHGRKTRREQNARYAALSVGSSGKSRG